MSQYDAEGNLTQVVTMLRETIQALILGLKQQVFLKTY